MAKLAKSNLSVDLNECTVTFEHVSGNRTDVRYENILFTDLLTVQLSNYKVDEADINDELVPADFNLCCFKAKFKDRGVKLIATANETDRLCWMRVMRLIAQMNRLEVDSKSVNLFAFE